ncbi:3-isopropylmalate dehydratase large subunit [Campylobacter sp. MIT 97-5078]|nr:3-isopropylmalate dehydratase [Campylobacter sp. MIT 97-5078]KGI57119.1 3-isopropylmalate dehydratase [Campylobacter sp. MIT 97-5078]TQR25484.1 3-isopropylmalate dehydratase large subunit [Campylobacter sp. MIT 97-5078]
MTMTQKILANGAGKDFVNAGELIMAQLDMVLGNDITTPVAINAFNKAKFSKVFDKSKISLVMDHFAPNKDIKAATQSQQCRFFANDFDIEHYYDVGNMGVEHALLPEQGIVTIGDLIIGADSHTCTYGALGAFSTGVGSTDMGVAMATGKAWFKVPQAMKFNIKGKLRPHISGKDVILHIIGKIGVDGALYKSMEFMGEGLKNLSIDDRLCIANMAIEAGAKNGIFAVDDITLEYAKGRSEKKPRIFVADEDAYYEQVFDINLDEIDHTVAFPHLPENARTKDEWGEIKIDQVVIGSCTNGRLSDMAVAAEILKGKKIAKNTRCIVIPATQNIYLECITKGYLKTFIEAGCVVSTPTCGPCLGGHMGILAANEKCVSTTNRNFVGRMGHETSQVFLASPEVAAASAISGILSTPEQVL